MKITDFNPFKAVAALFREVDKDKEVFLGTCFAFRQLNYFLTAAHCIGNLSRDEILIVHPSPRLTLSCQEIIKHPTADIALILTETFESEEAQFFWGYKKKYALGSDFKAFGFPEDVFGKDASMPTARLFKGHFQRYLEQESYLGYTYKAGELSIACPGGLSGGPVFITNFGMYVYGLITENLQSTTFLDSVEEIQKDGSVLKKHYQNVINYGLCVMLADIADWINENIPKNNEKITV